MYHLHMFTQHYFITHGALVYHFNVCNFLLHLEQLMVITVAQWRMFSLFSVFPCLWSYVLSFKVSPQVTFPKNPHLDSDHLILSSRSVAGWLCDLNSLSLNFLVYIMVIILLCSVLRYDLGPIYVEVFSKGPIH